MPGAGAGVRGVGGAIRRRPERPGPIRPDDRPAAMMRAGLTGPVAIVLGVAAVSVASAAGILWGVREVSPGRAGLLLMMEVVTGLASAAAFAGEPFGAARIAGSMLIVSAALVEVLPPHGRPP